MKDRADGDERNQAPAWSAYGHDPASGMGRSAGIPGKRPATLGLPAPSRAPGQQVAAAPALAQDLSAATDMVFRPDLFGDNTDPGQGEPGEYGHPEPQSIDVDAVRLNDVIQQREALMGGASAEAVLAANARLRTELQRLAAERQGAAASQASGGSSPEQVFADLQAQFVQWADSVLFREGSGARALGKLARREAEVVARNQRYGDDEQTTREDVAYIREQHAARFAPAMQALEREFLASVSGQPSASGAAAAPETAATTIADDVLQNVIPNDPEQQKRAVVGAISAFEVFDLDANFQEQVRMLAANYAALDGRKSMEEAARRASESVHEELGDSDAQGFDMELAEVEDMAAEAAVELAFEDHQAWRFTEMREKFAKWGGRVIFERSTGGALLARLRKQEKQLVARMRRKSAAELAREVVLLRRRHAQEFAPVLARIKEQFVQTAEVRLRFLYESQGNVKANYKMRQPGDDAEPAKAIKDLGGVVTASEKAQDLEVAESVVKFAEELKASLAFGVEISTYDGHSWGRYSLDLFPKVPRDESRGFYEQEAVFELFMTIESVAKQMRMRWRALYNDFDVAQRVNEAIGSRRIGFQWEHGPAPYVLHIHLDLMPERLYKEK